MAANHIYDAPALNRAEEGEAMTGARRVLLEKLLTLRDRMNRTLAITLLGDACVQATDPETTDRPATDRTR